jgi:hypothetical protein
MVKDVQASCQSRELVDRQIQQLETREQELIQLISKADVIEKVNQWICNHFKK